MGDEAVTTIGELAGLKHLSTGKVRELYAVDDDSILFVATDRISAFDVVMLNGIPGKGKILTQLSVFWFTKLFNDQKFGRNHLITANVDEMPEKVQKHAKILRGRSMLVKKVNVIMLEAIVRGYITGSGWKDYKRSGSVCSIPLPDGLKHCQQLPKVLFTPSTKAEMGQHDENISAAEAEEKVGKALYDSIEARSLQLYSAASEFAKQKNIIIADTKFEFGTDKNGELYLIDEVLTPDSSRFWDVDKYAVGRNQDSYDKQYVRDYLESIKFDKKTAVAIPDDVVRNTMKKYVEIYKILTGEEPKL
uniref:phosphoribosylaminoimidazolesuccinocarboxamide synthase n=1 Tax=Hirondellea gigas TaxID=1518452 RepID=A0A6A7GBV3_9CRUS